MDLLPLPVISKLFRELNTLRLRIEELSSAIEKHSKAIHAEKESQNENGVPTKPLPVIVAYNEQTINDNKAYKNREHCTQEAIKKWTKRAVIAASVYAAVAALQWFQMREATGAADQSAKAARAAARVAQRQLELSQRPWLAVANSPSLGQNDKHAWIIDFEIQNFGHSPALHISPNTSLGFAPFSGNLEVLIGARCSEGEEWTLGIFGKESTMNPRPESLGYTIFPGTHIYLKQTVGNAESSVTFYGCLTYLDQFADPSNRKGVHHTPYCYNARQPFFVGQKMTPCFTVKPPD
jgi:hypothetical protein